MGRVGGLPRGQRGSTPFPARAEGAPRGRRSAGRRVPRGRGSSCLQDLAVSAPWLTGFPQPGQRPSSSALAPGPAAQREAVILLNLEPELLTFRIPQRAFQNCHSPCPPPSPISKPGNLLTLQSGRVGRNRPQTSAREGTVCYIGYCLKTKTAEPSCRQKGTQKRIIVKYKRLVKEGVSNYDKLSSEFRNGALMTLRLFAKAANGLSETLKVPVS